jgi:putative tryptophan/tyrosine transport system substrate-binding protein
VQRRQFIAGLGSAAAWPLAARAQQARKLPTIGLMGATTPSAQTRWTAAFVQRLRDLNWIEGRTVTIEYRWSEGRSERLAEIAAEFVRLKVDVIVTPGGGAFAAKRATSTIPIVFTAATDPVGSGLVAGLARPGSNVTGMSLQAYDLASKRLELLRAVLNGLRRVGIMANASYSAPLQEMREVREAANKLGLEVLTREIRRAEEIGPAFATFKDRADALYVVADPLMSTNRVSINTLAFGARLPTMHGFREFVDEGGLMSYGPSFSDLYRRAAELVDKILRGAKPADIPVEQPTKFELVINLKTAKALGLTIPETLLATADEVIQ